MSGIARAGNPDRKTMAVMNISVSRQGLGNGVRRVLVVAS
jgi:hypothetical protein